MRRDDLDSLYRLGVSSEHSNEHVVHNLDLCLVRCCDLNEHVLRIQCDLAVVSVDDRRQRQNGAVCVVNDGVDGRIPDDVQVAAKVLVLLLWGQLHGSSGAFVSTNLVKLHKLLRVHLLCLVERDELNLLRLESLVCEGALDRCHLLVVARKPMLVPPTIEIVCSDGDQCTLASQVLVQLVLERNEGVVARLCEGDAS